MISSIRPIETSDRYYKPLSFRNIWGFPNFLFFLKDFQSRPVYATS
jgi:hypothetical protein